MTLLAPIIHIGSKWVGICYELLSRLKIIKLLWFILIYQRIKGSSLLPAFKFLTAGEFLAMVYAVF
jgi:hypothetical protein